jgi:hypothetical protein
MRPQAKRAGIAGAFYVRKRHRKRGKCATSFGFSTYVTGLKALIVKNHRFARVLLAPCAVALAKVRPYRCVPEKVSSG